MASVLTRKIKGQRPRIHPFSLTFHSDRERELAVLHWTTLPQVFNVVLQALPTCPRGKPILGIRILKNNSFCCHAIVATEKLVLKWSFQRNLEEFCKGIATFMYLSWFLWQWAAGKHQNTQCHVTQQWYSELKRTLKSTRTQWIWCTGTGTFHCTISTFHQCKTKALSVLLWVCLTWFTPCSSLHSSCREHLPDFFLKWQNSITGTDKWSSSITCSRTSPQRWASGSVHTAASGSRRWARSLSSGEPWPGQRGHPCFGRASSRLWRA